MRTVREKGGNGENVKAKKRERKSCHWRRVALLGFPTILAFFVLVVLASKTGLFHIQLLVHIYSKREAASFEM